MATLADELLNDFEDSGSEHDEEANGFQEGEENATNEKEHNLGSPDIALDGDEEEMGDAEEEVAARDDDLDDEYDTKAKVEKMRLGGVRDVRTVAGLMKTLQPVLEVSSTPIYSFEP